MRMMIFVMLFVISLNVFANKADIKCYSGKELFFHKIVNDALVGEGSIIVNDDKYTYFIYGDCVIRYCSKDLK